jgi:lipoprotein-anchoring transpeptidase ErfK/SrfK
MKPDPESVRKILLNAKQAMQRGDRQAARSWAEQAVSLDPDSEEPWLFLAALSSPRASVEYLERALKINPHSQRARKGMHWAVERLRHEQMAPSSEQQIPARRGQRVTPEVDRDAQPVTGKSAATESKSKPHISKLSTEWATRSAYYTDLPSSRSIARYRWSFLTLFLVAICISAAWVFWPGNASPVLAFLHAPHSAPVFPGILAVINKPTYTPSPTTTFTPTATFTWTSTSTPTPTSTPTSTPTPTSTFTLTPTFTPTPIPTDTPLPTEFFTSTSTPEPINTEIPWPTSTTEPVVNTGGGDGVRWIDVNLSEQRLYAYEGNTIAASFLVSTGLSQFPTVTGQYHIYIKLISTSMSGPGYYLPDVPYTMYFYKGYGIHGTYWHNNFGTPMSHGCVNMYTPDAEWVYYWASVGTLVNVHY